MEMKYAVPCEFFVSTEHAAAKEGLCISFFEGITGKFLGMGENEGVLTDCARCK
jgi:hypothetical protein